MVVGDYLDRWLQDRRTKRIQKARNEGAEEGRAQGRAQGTTEGQARTHAMWEEWNNRRMAAEATGARFDELPPTVQANGREE